MRTGVTNLPLHGGSCPRWLFPRMKKLAGAISEAIVDEYGRDELLRRVADPNWFQALGSTIGFDWHSSGLTTTTAGALKESINHANLGVTIAGGKGQASRKTLKEIEDNASTTSHAEKLTRSSRLTAKADTALIQDRYQLYHHVFTFTDNGKWAVIQQGMNTRYARRYHWLSDTTPSYTEHDNAIIGDRQEQDVLHLATEDSRENRNVTLDLAKDHPNKLLRHLHQPSQTTLGHYDGTNPGETTYTQRHTIKGAERINHDTLKRAYEYQPSTYEELLLTKGMGAKTIRSLSLVADLIHGAPAAWRDPVTYSFAHGGKDGIPRPVDRNLMDRNTRFLKDAIRQARLGEEDRRKCLKRLSGLVTTGRTGNSSRARPSSAR